MRTGKKWLAAVLSLMMALTMMPLTAAAANDSNDEDTYTVVMYRVVFDDEGQWDSDSDFMKGYDPETYIMKDAFKIPSVQNAGSEIRMEVLKNGEAMDPDDYDIEWDFDENMLSVEEPSWLDEGQFEMSGKDTEGSTDLTAKVFNWDDELLAEKTWNVELYDAYMLSVAGGWETLVKEKYTYQADWRSMKTYETSPMPACKWEVVDRDDIQTVVNEDQTFTVTMPDTPQTIKIRLTVYDKNPAEADAQILSGMTATVKINKTRPAVGIEVKKLVNNQPKAVSGNFVSGVKYRFCMTGVNFLWMTIKDDPFYTWTVKGPSKTITLKPEQNGKKYTDFTDQGPIYGGDMPYRFIVFKSPGKYTIKATGYHNGKDKSAIKDFKVVPKGTSITKLTPASKGFTVKWKKQAAQTTGYQIQYATNKKFTTGKKTITISKTGTVSKKVNKLKAKKKYYVRVRTYKTVKGTKYCSSWSATKTVTTKK